MKITQHGKTYKLEKAGNNTKDWFIINDPKAMLIPEEGDQETIIKVGKRFVRIKWISESK